MSVRALQQASCRDRWLTAVEAKDDGIIDHVIVDRDKML